MYKGLCNLYFRVVWGKKIKVGISVKVAAIQLNSGENKELNLKKATNLIRDAASQGSELVVLPEYVTYMGEDEQKVKQAETIPGETTDHFKQLAKELNIYIHAGSILEVADKHKSYNTSVLINPDGKIIAKYRKIHLYDAYIEGRVDFRESDTIYPGEEIVAVETDFGTVGLTICYDLRFPELFRSLALKGAKIIFVPAAFPFYTGSAHWETLIRARAIENQCFLIAAAQIGPSKPNNLCFGHSMIVDPWGTVLARAAEGEGIVMADIDLNRIEEVRQYIPCFSHRTPSIYQS